MYHRSNQACRVLRLQQPSEDAFFDASATPKNCDRNTNDLTAGRSTDALDDSDDVFSTPVKTSADDCTFASPPATPFPDVTSPPSVISRTLVEKRDTIQKEASDDCRLRLAFGVDSPQKKLARPKSVAFKLPFGGALRRSRRTTLAGDAFRGVRVLSKVDECESELESCGKKTSTKRKSSEHLLTPDRSQLSAHRKRRSIQSSPMTSASAVPPYVTPRRHGRRSAIAFRLPAPVTS